MLDDIDALTMLERFGTVSEAAVRLRLTQSAVSKRIQNLQHTLGFALVEPAGRRLRLTPRAVEFLERARPLVAELRAVARPAGGDSPAAFSLALADSIASSWGPGVVRAAMGEAGMIGVELHAHRSVLVIESVRLGRYQIGLCTGATAAADLVSYAVVDEPLVLVRCGFGQRGGDASVPLLAIEPHSATWRAVEAPLQRHHRHLLQRPLVGVESFPAVMQMVRAGFGDGLAPLGLVREMRLDPGSYRRLRKVSRGVVLVARKTVHQAPAFQAFRERLIRRAQEYFAASRLKT